MAAGKWKFLAHPTGRGIYAASIWENKQALGYSRAFLMLGIEAVRTPRSLQTWRLTFIGAVAGYGYEGAHTVYWLVHPFRPVLARGVARGDSSADYLAHLPAITLDWNHCACRVCIDSRGVVFAGAHVGWKKDLARFMERRKEGNGLETFMEHWGIFLIPTLIGIATALLLSN